MRARVVRRAPSESLANRPVGESCGERAEPLPPRAPPFIAAKVGRIRDVTTPALPALAIARIDEATCIGCTLCIDACPFDAIVGAAKRMHTVLPALCTGCALCLPPCPVDCIAMVPAGRAWSRADSPCSGRAQGRAQPPYRAGGRGDARASLRRTTNVTGDARQSRLRSAARARGALAFGSGRK